VVDLRVVSLALGLLPFLALALRYGKGWLEVRPDRTWGMLAGAIAFLGLGHAVAAALLDASFLSRAFDETAGLLLPLLGLGIGLGAAWWVLESPTSAMGVGTGRVAWAAALYLALHSIADGLVVGEVYLGGADGIAVDAVAVSATVVHRLAEGALVAVPAILAGWRSTKILGALSGGLLVLPAAALVGLVSSGFDSYASAVIHLASVATASSVEAGFALILLLTAIVPRATGPGRPRWALWMASAFLVLAFVHGLVE
jgi:zinc transporter ZupT